MYGVQSMMRWINELSPKESDGKVAPSLLLLDGDHFEEYWDDLQQPGW
jgi:hypothetical protein